MTSGTGSFAGVSFLPRQHKGFSVCALRWTHQQLLGSSSVGFTFDLTSIDNIVKSPGAIAFHRQCIIHSTIAGLDSTPGIWSLTATPLTALFFVGIDDGAGASDGCRHAWIWAGWICEVSEEAASP